MKFKATLLLFLFVAFLATPAIITLSNRDADISVFFSLTEEENHVKLHQPVSEFEIKKNKFNITAIQFLKQKKLDGSRYVNHYNDVDLEILSPPPRHS